MALHQVALVLCCLAAASTAYLVDPPTTAPSDTISDCSNWAVASSSDTCDTLAKEGGEITLEQFLSYNPSLQNGCNIIVGDSYCIEEDFGIPPPTSTTTSAASTSTGNGVTTPSPIQTGMTSNCNKFYLVKTGDNCANIASAYGISLSDFYSWNPAAGSTCGTLGAKDYVCVGVLGQTVTTTSTPNNGVSTPQPIQTGMTSNCDKFYFVKTGDGCAAIASNFGITLSQFYAWNPAVGSSCATLAADDYVCVGILGQTVSTTSTSAGNGVSTPTPVQTGITGNCNKFYDVVTGDTCAAIASSYGIALSDFYVWNPAVGSSCGYLQAGDYVCVGIIGHTTMTTTSKGNGISTPSPIQTGMVSNCNKFYDVVTGDGCQAVADKFGITLVQFYSWNPAVGSTCAYLDVGDYVCVGIIGFTATTTTAVSSTKTTPGNGVSTPTPTQPGIVSNCNKFHYTVNGDTCQSISTAAGISLADFEAWNTGVGANCGGLWLKTYCCIGLISKRR